MSSGKFPRANVNDVPKQGTDPMIVQVPFHSMDIGARASGLPKSLSGTRSLEHVGSSSGKKG